MNTIEKDNKFVANTYGRFNVAIESGKGSLLFDQNGKEYIDFGSGIGVTAFGINDQDWKNSVTNQINKIQHTSNLYYTNPCADLAKLLCEKTGFDKVFFSNSGAEANECAIKFARKYSHDKYNIDRSDIVTLVDSFHGRTITTLAATGQDMFHTDFNPFTKGFKYCPANDIDSLKDIIDENVCAIMFECVQGEGGVIDLNKDFVQAIGQICKENDILAIVDEVQTGNGRTGKYFSYEHYDIEPDIITTAKGLGGGLPIGAAIFNSKVSQIIVPGSHGSTYGGNPVCAAGAISIVSRIDDNLLSQVQEKGKYIREFLSTVPNIKSISGKGLIVGFECEKDAGQVAKQCLENGLLVLTAHKNKIRLLPALNIDMELIDKGLNIIKGVVE